MTTFQAITTEDKARAGILSTAHGVIDTPVFMPVGTQGTVKAAMARDLWEMGARIMLGNAYHLYLRPGDGLVREMGGIQKFSGWDGAVLTDSGGYQIFSLNVLRKLKEEGVEFQSHIDGSRHFLTPERVVEIQENLGSDICMCLDECVSFPSSYDYTRDSVGLTTRWARRCKAAKKENDQQLFGIVQGGTFADLRRRSADELVALDFNGYALGGFSVGEPKAVMWEMAEIVLSRLPEEKPRYLMGLGFPEDIIYGVGLGIDMFDCVIPTRHARNGNLFTSSGRLNIKHARFTKDSRPIDEACTCYTCSRFSRAYLRHLFISRELTAYVLNTIHNLHFYMDLMRKIRESIKQLKFNAFRDAFLAQWKGGELDD